MPLTKSEELFEEYCATHRIALKRIPSSEVRTPDYVIDLGVRVACEVKQIELNPEERKSIKAVLSGTVFLTGGEPGHRVRKMITDASPQIRQFTNGEIPGLLVLFEEYVKHTSDYNVRVAMYGFDTIFISPVLRKAEDRKSGSKKKVTENNNTSLSAVAVLRKHDDGTLHCRVFHNVHARSPLPRELLANDCTKHFRRREKEVGMFDDWEEY